MKKYLVGVISGLAGVLALKIAYRKGVKDGFKFTTKVIELCQSEEETEES